MNIQRECRVGDKKKIDIGLRVSRIKIKFHVKIQFRLNR